MFSGFGLGVSYGMDSKLAALNEQIAKVEGEILTDLLATAR